MRYKRLWWLLFGLLVAVGCASAPAYKPEVTGAPRLKVDKDKIDFGDTQVGQAVTASFELMNVGDQPLVIQQPPYIEVAAGC